MNQVKTGWGEIASHMCPVSCEQIQHGLITLNLIDQIFDVDLHRWTPVT